MRLFGMAEEGGSFHDALERIDAGDPLAAEALFPLVYADLRAAAAAMLRHERPGHTLQPTGLVHEAFLRLAGGTRVAWTSQAHFRAIAARAMAQSSSTVVVPTPRTCATSATVSPPKILISTIRACRGESAESRSSASCRSSTSASTLARFMS